jgi:RNA polymerase sigma factor (sigma-70 family)
MGTDFTADSTRAIPGIPVQMDGLPAELCALFKAQDGAARDQAWETFVKTHGRLLFHVARTAQPGYDQAMDRYAYILERLRTDDFRRLKGYATREGARFSSWLGIVATRLCVDYHRHRYGRADPGTAADALETRSRRLVDFISSEIDLGIVPDTATPDPEASLRVTELRCALEEAVCELPSRDRLLLTLRFANDASAREIAEAMDFASPFHVYRRLKKVFATLRQALVKRGIDNPEP